MTTKKQLDGYTTEICNPFDLVAKFKAFGLNSFRVDGADIGAIDSAIQSALDYKETATVIVLDTIKGQGVPLVSDVKDNHHIRWSQEDREKIEQFTLDLEKENA